MRRSARRCAATSRSRCPAPLRKTPVTGIRHGASLGESKQCTRMGCYATRLPFRASEARRIAGKLPSELVADGEADAEGGERKLHRQRSHRQPPHGEGGIGLPPLVAEADRSGESLPGGEGDAASNPGEISLLEEAVDPGAHRRRVEV